MMREAWMYALVCFLVVGPSNGEYYIKCSKERLRNDIKVLYGETRPLADFTFFDESELQSFVDQGSLPRTELEKAVNLTVPKPSKAEEILAKALQMLRNGSNVELITSVATELEKLINNKGLTGDLFKSCFLYNLIKSHRSFTRRRRRKYKNRRVQSRRKSTFIKSKNLRARRRQVRHYKRHSFKKGPFKRRFRVKRKRYYDDEEEYLNYDEIPFESNDIIHDGVFKEDHDNDYTKFPLQDTTSFRSSKPLKTMKSSPVEDYDFHRMRRAASFTVTGNKVCLNEGDLTNKNTVFLCSTCYNTVDFGQAVLPQFASSVECKQSSPKCLSGDGICTQKVVYYTFHQLTPNSNNVWTTFQQPLNVSCECECLQNSITQVYLVGNSNP